LASVAWAFGFGLGAPLASLWLRDAGCSDTLIGLNTGVYYAGIAAAAGFVPALIRRWDRYCPVLGMILSGATVAAFPWIASSPGWFALRLVNGIAAALTLIPLETRVNRDANPAERARNFGFYAFSIALGWALGNLVGLEMYSGHPGAAFMLGGTVSVLASLPVLCWPPWPIDKPEEHREQNSIELRRNLLSFGSAWSQGFLEGGMVAFMSVYLLFLGMSETRVGWLTSSIMLGVILFQVPVAWLADQLGRTRMLLACYLVTAGGLGFLQFCGDSSWLVLALFLVGACSGAFYPLGLAILGERVPGPLLARASAWFLGINCCGSLIGPIVTGAAMDRFGKAAMFGVGGAAVIGVLVLCICSRIYDSRRPSRREQNASAGLEMRRAA
jgi:MFS family permease